MSRDYAVRWGKTGVRQERYFNERCPREICEQILLMSYPILPLSLRFTVIGAHNSMATLLSMQFSFGDYVCPPASET